LDGT
jgi:hypothetical protein